MALAVIGVNRLNYRQKTSGRPNLGHYAEDGTCRRILCLITGLSTGLSSETGINVRGCPVRVQPFFRLPHCCRCVALQSAADGAYFCFSNIFYELPNLSTLVNPPLRLGAWHLSLVGVRRISLVMRQGRDCLRWPLNWRRGRRRLKPCRANLSDQPLSPAGTEMVVVNPLERKRREQVIKRDGFYPFKLPPVAD